MDWRDRAACLDVDPELFFPIGNTGPALAQIEEAKAVCLAQDLAGFRRQQRQAQRPVKAGLFLERILAPGETILQLRLLGFVLVELDQLFGIHRPLAFHATATIGDFVKVLSPRNLLDPHIVRHIVQRAQRIHPDVISLVQVDDHPRLFVRERLEVHALPCNWRI